MELDGSSREEAEGEAQEETQKGQEATHEEGEKKPF